MLHQYEHPHFKLSTFERSDLMKAVLCEARHEHPAINGLPAIYPNQVNPMDFITLDQFAADFLMSSTNATDLALNGLDLYVTGLTPAVVAVIRQCINNAIELRLWHYDRQADDYVCQPCISICMEEQAYNSYGVTVPYAPKLSTN
jgi:hypothetical protein